MPRNLELVAASSLLLAGSFACGGQPTDQVTPPAHDARYIQGFDPPAESEGFTRFILPAVENIQPGHEEIWCQWISGPAENDGDVVEVHGLQSLGGHHAVLYATTDLQPVGTTRPCIDNDLTFVRYLGGIGGEGATAMKLPDNVVYRLPKGVALMANVHYVNATEKAIAGQGVVDLKMIPSDPNNVVASLYTNVDVDNIHIQPGAQQTLDVTCDFQQDIEFFSFFNHMHKLGTTAYTEVLRANGNAEMIVNDRVWQPEQEFAPSFTMYPLNAPLTIKSGDRVHTHCEWNNDTSGVVEFPTEMCAGVGFYIGSGIQVICIQGIWTN